MRPITAEEYPAFHRALETAFGHHPSDEEIADWRSVFDVERSLAVFDAGEIVATAGANTFDLTVPGGCVAAAGVTAVGVRPTHRRRGLLRALMGRQLDDIATRGEPVAVLTASESVIYGRFGYGLAVSKLRWRLDVHRVKIDPPPPTGGRIRLVGPDEAAEVFPDLYERARRRRPGEVSWSPAWWDKWFRDRERDRHGASARFYAVHDDGGGRPDGCAAWRIKGAWQHSVPCHQLWLEALHATDDDVEAALWDQLLSIDLVGSVHVPNRPVDEPLRWRLDDPRRLAVTDVLDHLWLRVLDPAAALAARRYGARDRVVLGLTDDFRPANDGCWEVDGSPEGGDARRTDGGADLELSASDLGAVYLGGVAPSVLARAGRVVERTPGALARADALFRSDVAPWCTTDF